MNKIDATMAILRISMGTSIAYHGINKARGIAGTTSWFSSIGMKWAKQQAVIAASTEIIAGVGLTLGLATPLTCVAVGSPARVVRRYDTDLGWVTVD